jgi:hypothetical protein
MPKTPNPQGKGLVPVLQGLEQHRVRASLPPKHIDQISLELFTSLFVLQSEFRFNPVPGQEYWMYMRKGGFTLSLVAPAEWHGKMPGRSIGRCILQDDRTWTLELDAPVAADTTFMAGIEKRRLAFQQTLENAETLEDILPVYDDSLGYYGKVLAFILGKSLRTSMQLSGIAALGYEQAKGLLAQLDTTSESP